MLVGVQINGFYQSVWEKTIKKERESFWGMEEGLCVCGLEREMQIKKHEHGKITAWKFNCAEISHKSNFKHPKLCHQHSTHKRSSVERMCSCTWVCLINSGLISQKNTFSEQEAFYQPDSLTCTSSCLLASSTLANRRMSKMNNWTTFPRWRLNWYTKHICICLALTRFTAWNKHFLVSCVY